MTANKTYRVVLTNTAKAALFKLDKHRQRLVGKQLRKLETAPELGKHCGKIAGIDLTGFRKLYVDRKSLRVIYSIDEAEVLVEVINIGARAELAAYKEAARFLQKRR